MHLQYMMDMMMQLCHLQPYQRKMQLIEKKCVNVYNKMGHHYANIELGERVLLPLLP